MRDHCSAKVCEKIFLKDLDLGVEPKCLISTLDATAVADIYRVACKTNVDPVESLCRSW